MPPAPPLSDADAALLELLRALERAAYRFITPTDATHRRILRRPAKPAPADLRDVFGWNRPFAQKDMPAAILALMRRAGVLRQDKAGLRSRLRVSSLDDRLFLHTGFPTTAHDAVFFGPDTYRFARFLHAHITEQALEGLLVDIGAGCGAGGLIAKTLAPGMSLVLADINPKALRLARINTLHAGVEAETVVSSGLAGIAGPASLIVANPPYIAGREGQAYQDGGDMHGTRMAADWAEQAMGKLAPGGRMLLYSGTAILGGHDPLKAKVAALAKAHRCDLEYQELDPDVFGEELRRPAYSDIERIAAVGAVISRR